MLPELKLKFAFPGFGSLELAGKSDGVEKIFQEISVIFVPVNSCNDNNGWVIKLTRNGNCYVQELKPLTEEGVDDGVGIA